ncbi:addiction module toxin RelE [Candidatus Parvarchaeota archaeon]|nr:addiction module toxin RelE [Candidatus Parvarchaeota archaeon]
MKGACVYYFDYSDKLKLTVKKLAKKDPKRCEILAKKIKEVVQSDEASIEHYKNMQYGLSDYKRVHIDSSFVLLFRVFREKKFILFVSLKHHDEAYKR